MNQDKRYIPKWYGDLTSPFFGAVSNRKDVKSFVDRNVITSKISDPPGFSIEQIKGLIGTTGNTHSTTQHTRRTLQKQLQETDELKLRRAREQAFSPAKNIPMNLIMSYFSGSSLQVITLSMTWMMFFNGPIKQLITVNDQFSKLETERNLSNIFVFKVIYCFFVILTMCVGVYKLSSMGILPNTASDWVAWETSNKVCIYIHISAGQYYVETHSISHNKNRYRDIYSGLFEH